MKQLDLQGLISLATFMAGAGSAVWAMIRIYADAEKKRYGEERDFKHLKGNQEQMQLSLASLSKEIDYLSDDVRTLTAVFNVMLAQQGQSVSGLLGYKKRD